MRRARLTGLLMSLRLRLLVHEAQRTGRAAGLVIAEVLVAALAGAWCIVTLIRLGQGDPTVAGMATIGIGAVLTLLWLALTVLLQGDDPLDARSFALLPVGDGRLATALLASSVVGALPVATIATGLATAITWIGHGVSPALAVGAGVCAGLTPVVVARTLATVLTRAVMSRWIARAAVLALLLAGPAIIAVNRLWVRIQTQPYDPTDLGALVEAVAWVPPLTAWGVGAAAAEGRTGAALGRAATAVAVLVIAVAVHRRGTVLRLRTAPAPVEVRPLLRLIPMRGRLGALVSRRLSYWYRDRRHVVEAGTCLVSAGMLATVGSIGEVPGWLPATGAALCAYTVGAPMINETAMDRDGMRMSRLCGVPGSADRLSRAVAHLVWSLPATVVISGAFAWSLGDHGVSVAGSVGTGTAVLAATVGIGALTSVALPRPVPPDDGRPFSGGTGAGIATLFTHALAAPAVAVLTLPVLAAPSLGLPSPLLLVIGPCYGLALLVPLIRRAGVYVDRRASDPDQALVA